MEPAGINGRNGINGHNDINERGGWASEVMRCRYRGVAAPLSDGAPRAAITDERQ